MKVVRTWSPILFQCYISLVLSFRLQAAKEHHQLKQVNSQINLHFYKSNNC